MPRDPRVSLQSQTQSMQLYRLEISRNKSYVYNIDTQEFSYIVKNEKDDLHILADKQRLSRLGELVRHRNKVNQLQRPLCTAFMMKLAEGFKHFRQASTSLKEYKAVKEEKEAIMAIFLDVLCNNVKPMFPEDFQEGVKLRSRNDEANCPLTEERSDAKADESSFNNPPTPQSTRAETDNVPSPAATVPLTGNVELRTPVSCSRKRVVRSPSTSSLPDIEIPDDVPSIERLVVKLEKEAEELEREYQVNYTKRQKAKKAKLVEKAKGLIKNNDEWRAKIKALKDMDDDSI